MKTEDKLKDLIWLLNSWSTDGFRRKLTILIKYYSDEFQVRLTVNQKATRT